MAAHVYAQNGKHTGSGTVSRGTTNTASWEVSHLWRGKVLGAAHIYSSATAFVPLAWMTIAQTDVAGRMAAGKFLVVVSTKHENTFRYMASRKILLQFGYRRRETRLLSPCGPVW